MSPTSRENRCGAEVLAGEGRMEVMNFVDVWEGDTPLLHEGGPFSKMLTFFLTWYSVSSPCGGSRAGKWSPESPLSSEGGR